MGRLGEWWGSLSSLPLPSFLFFAPLFNSCCSQLSECLEQASIYYNKMIHGLPDMEHLLFQDHSQRRTENTKIWGIHKIVKFPKECHLLAFIMLLSGTVWALRGLCLEHINFRCGYFYLYTLLLVLRLWGYCYSESCANHSPWIKSYSQVRILI